MSVGIDGLAAAISEELQNYSEEVENKIDEGIDGISKEIVDELKNDPAIPTNTGKYKKSFYMKTVAKGRGFKRNVIANKQHRLTHLLERSHAINGGTGRTKAHPHWKPAEERAENKMERLLGEI